VNHASSHSWQGPSWIRTHKLPAALISALIIVVVVVAIVAAAHGGGSAPTSTNTSTPAAKTTATTKGEKWLDGRAGTNLQAVNADVVAINAAHRSGSRSAIERAGRHLGAEATGALRDPVAPVDASLYRTALGDFARAGRDAAGADFRAAAPLLDAGIIDITQVTAAVNSPAPAKAPATVTDPNSP